MYVSLSVQVNSEFLLESIHTEFITECETLLWVHPDIHPAPHPRYCIISCGVDDCRNVGICTDPRMWGNMVVRRLLAFHHYSEQKFILFSIQLANTSGSIILTSRKTYHGKENL